MSKHSKCAYQVKMGYILKDILSHFSQYFLSILIHVLKVHVEYEKRKKKELTEEFLKYCWENKLDKVSDCLSRGVDVNTVSEDGYWTALHIACFAGYVELLNILVEEPNLDVNKTVRVAPQQVLAARRAALRAAEQDTKSAGA